MSVEVSEPRDLFHFRNVEYPNELMSHEEYFSIKTVEHARELMRHKAYFSTRMWNILAS
jgi:hypothetical protein